ncbi:unnamed protein product [Eruca vesicaria subsp. sativa]|uniref:Cytochrome P450 n=1 Tax=Eruca vesicaria subsp. sativa TaxID=29727 RepID=A0ABC8LVA1_ERUVS|nr:unnamed protein product [Eruca vesicaria subsp. sativa]
MGFEPGKQNEYVVYHCCIRLLCFYIHCKEHKNDKEKSTSWTTKTSYNWKLAPVGIKTSPSMFKLSEKYGSLISLKFGNVYAVVESTPETVKEFLKTFNVDCCSRPYMTYVARLTYNRKDLAFSLYRKYWRELRKMTVVELYTAKMVNFNLKLMKLSANVICRLGFGITLEGSNLENTYDKVIQGIMEVGGSFAAADFFPIFGGLIDRLTGLHSKCEKVFKAVDTFFDQAIQQHLHDEGTKDDIIHLLLKMERGVTGLGEFQLNRNHTKGILRNILSGGIDTSAHTATWVMTHLITNPRVMKKVEAEMREVIKHKDNITEEDIEKLAYLKMVIKVYNFYNILILILYHLLYQLRPKTLKVKSFEKVFWLKGLGFLIPISFRHLFFFYLG